MTIYEHPVTTELVETQIVVLGEYYPYEAESYIAKRKAEGWTLLGDGCFHSANKTEFTLERRVIKETGIEL